ncbi:type II toxin-antitoxin system HicA family toxin [Erwinia sp. S43]|uniref:type II toxin-antitoxin system HicA family toxin n=1 Tax=Erwinia sp. INIA01 TaxID=2991500 RepID=UPI001909A43B|nr:MULTISPECIES: type II toxin-antitoxin system HicA family toxin [unclassified Erwinia]MBK0004701.1 type II toxin-antitoxin system HicA family toxin [Erwinia sp. S38]MBK0035723.1 type II toxin-antitoxin system HicA family toxin [Erwinia sp. S43]MCW1874258.1 type II toxin-antitoxin system HicA family toxin [Erwinia sp. INIA01]
MKSSELIKLLKDHGWSRVRITGSHHTFKHPDSANLVTVPHPNKDLKIGTVRQVLKKAGIE